MGLFSWLLKSGPGSPGSTATVIVKVYNSLTKQEQGETEVIDQDFVFAEIVGIRKYAERQYGRVSWLIKYDTQKLVRDSYGQLTLLIFNIMYLESGQFRLSMSSSEMIKSVLETIGSVVEEMLPERRGKENVSSNFEPAI